MNLHRHLFGLMAALALGLHAPSSSGAEKKAWITIGDAAFRQVRQLVPSIVSVESHQLAGGGQKIHAVSVSEAEIDTVASIIHQRLQQCGGFVYHKAEAEARAALRNSAATEFAPSYVIDHRDLVEQCLHR